MHEPIREKDKDKSAKWLIEHHGDAILRLGGVTDLVRWQAAPAELVLPAKLPDGLLFAWRAGRDHPEPYVAEIATYSEQRAAEQALRDLLLVLSHPQRGSQRPDPGPPTQGAAPRPRPRASTRLGRGDGAGRPVAGGRVVDCARRAGAGDIGSRDDAVGALDGSIGTTRGRAAAVP
jgi:hypothetical protein